MTNTQKMPTYYELIEISNSELMSRVNIALSALQAAANRGEDIVEKKRIYAAFQDESVKRRNLGKKITQDKPSTC